MTPQILIVEPYEALAEMLSLSLESMGYSSEIARTDAVDEQQLVRGRFACVFINLDQNDRNFQVGGLKIAELASTLGIPVVMIPDNDVAQRIISERGWIQIRKPFKFEALQRVMELALKHHDIKDALFEHHGSQARH